jgi:flagellar basal body-associated protein FliL
MKITIALSALLLGCCALLAALPAHASSGGGGGHGEKKEKKGGEKYKAPKKARTMTSLESWVMIDPFTVSIIQDGRVRGRFIVSFGMDVPDEALRAAAEAMMPRLRDTWLMDLNLYAATTLRPRRAADVAGVSNLLQSDADRVLGKTGSKVLMAQATVEMTQ